MVQLTTEEIIHLFDEQLPALLDERPDLEPRIYHAFLKTFTRKEEAVALQTELREFRAETRANFEQVDQRFERVDQRLDALEETLRYEIRQQIGRLGSRWGIYNESLFRQTIASLVEKSFGVKVKKKVIDGEEFDVLIYNGEHILVEITARAKSNIQQRLERKQELYIQTTGVCPTRVILAVASIHSQRAQALREAGFEVIEPEEDLEDW